MRKKTCLNIVEDREPDNRNKSRHLKIDEISFYFRNFGQIKKLQIKFYKKMIELRQKPTKTRNRKPLLEHQERDLGECWRCSIIRYFPLDDRPPLMSVNGLFYSASQCFF